MTRASAIALVLVAGCSAQEPQSLLVDLKTDFAPGVEFAIVETDLSRVSDRGVRSSTARFELRVTGDEAFLDGVRVAEFETPNRALALDLSLLTADGRVLARRDTLLAVDRPSAVTVLLTRSCESVVCANAADGTPMTCIGGVCVDATCSPEMPESCGAGECSAVEDCTDGLALECASARCINDYCFVSGDSSLCPEGDRCDLVRGCVPEDALECRDDTDCMRDNAVGTCNGASRCEIVACDAGFGDCDRLTDNGCEADLAQATHCGSCDNPCGPWPNVQDVTCEEGTCSITACLAGFEDCDANISSGCETNLGLTCGICGGCGGLTCCSGACVSLNSNNNCGACGRRCGGVEYCAGGVCRRI